VTPSRITVPDAELAVLEVLWDRGTATIREIADRLYPGGGASPYSTVQKLLERLEGRGAVARRREGRAHVFRARVARADLIRDRLRDAADRFCGGSIAPLLTQLVGARGLTPDEIRELKALVERLDETEAGNPAGEDA
jgi:predicted transcriptional regulator